MEGTGDKGFITGEGTVVEVAPADRDDPVTMEGEDLEGEPVALEDYRGKPTVVVVWGSWCSPCRAEAPELAELATELDGEVGFLGVNIRDASTAQAQKFVSRFDIPYRSVFSPDGTALLAFDGTLTPNTIPATVVLDAEGRVAASIIGKLPSAGTLKSLTDTVLAEGTAEEPAEKPGKGPAEGEPAGG
ncbi:TlpA family protein disulfide reductase [Nocardioides pacificus]